MEDRRVCWASASEMENRLTDILRGECEWPTTAETFERVYQECYLLKKPLGETLVARGLVTGHGLRCALRDHTAEAIARLAAASELDLTWAPKSAQPYDARFTFGTPELLCWIGSMGSRSIANEADRKLREVTPEHSVGIAFAAGSDYPLPLAQVAAESWSCQALVDLGEWAKTALGDEGASERESVLGSDTVSSLKRAWVAGDILFVRWTGEDEPPSSRPGDAFDLTAGTHITGG
ncbi:MAG: hypothetical protein ACRD3V_32395 [Vicinamibacteria bacterium]